MWCEIVGWLLASGPSRLQLHTSPAVATMESSRRRTGSPSAANTGASSAASSSLSSAVVRAGQHHEAASAEDSERFGDCAHRHLLLTAIDLLSTLNVSMSINVLESLMARVQLALNVSDLDEAISFYSSLFGTSPAKVQPGYANFAIADPPLKLVLMEQRAPGALASGARSTTSAWR